MNLQEFTKAYIETCTDEDLEKDAVSAKGMIAAAKKAGKSALAKGKKVGKAAVAKAKDVGKKVSGKVKGWGAAGKAFVKKHPVAAGATAAGVAGAGGFGLGRASKKSAPETEKAAAVAKSMFSPFGSSLKKMWGGIATKGKGTIGKAWGTMSAAEKAALIGMGGTAAAGAGGVAAGRASKD